MRAPASITPILPTLRHDSIPDPVATPAATTVDDLKNRCDDAYKQFANSCSHAVRSIIRQLVDPDFPEIDANAMVEYFVTSSDWREVEVDEGWRLTERGCVVVGGLKNPKGHGHVIVMYPGEKKPTGGYLYDWKDPKTGKTMKLMMDAKGFYPSALSTSMGPWPGAMSRGDKTVWDPWPSAWDDVRFWVNVEDEERHPAPK